MAGNTNTTEQEQTQISDKQQEESNHGVSSNAKNTEDELAYLSQNFSGQCKVMNGSRHFPFTVKLHPDKLDIVFNFKLTEKYPIESPLKTVSYRTRVSIRDYHDFVPHMTLMKISRPFSKRTGKKYVAPWLYSKFNCTEFGKQTVDNVHLCEMGDGREEDGFYMTATSLSI